MRGPAPADHDPVQRGPVVRQRDALRLYRERPLPHELAHAPAREPVTHDDAPATHQRHLAPVLYGAVAVASGVGHFTQPDGSRIPARGPRAGHQAPPREWPGRLGERQAIDRYAGVRLLGAEAVPQREVGGVGGAARVAHDASPPARDFDVTQIGVRVPREPGTRRPARHQAIPRLLAAVVPSDVIAGAGQRCRASGRCRRAASVRRARPARLTQEPPDFGSRLVRRHVRRGTASQRRVPGQHQGALVGGLHGYQPQHAAPVLVTQQGP